MRGAQRVAAVFAGEAVRDGQRDGAAKGDHDKVHAVEGKEKVDEVVGEGENAGEEAKQDYSAALCHGCPDLHPGLICGRIFEKPQF